MLYLQNSGSSCITLNDANSLTRFKPTLWSLLTAYIYVLCLVVSYMKETNRFSLSIWRNSTCINCLMTILTKLWLHNCTLISVKWASGQPFHLVEKCLHPVYVRYFCSLLNWWKRLNVLKPNRLKYSLHRSSRVVYGRLPYIYVSINIS